MICENCEKEYEGISKRFCSKKCGYSFSTKAKRKEINEKVAKALRNKPRKNIEYVTIVCKTCEKEFTRDWGHRYTTHCSHYCTSHDPVIKEKLSKDRISKIIAGKVNDYGAKMTYFFKDEPIRCDSKIEYACLNFFDQKGASSIERCNFFIEYKDDENTRRYNPDFKINVDGEIYIVEAKSYMSLAITNEKWRSYNELSILKKIALEKYCIENNFKSFWFTKDLNIKFYNTCILEAKNFIQN